MSETLARNLCIACRTTFVVGNSGVFLLLWILQRAQTPADVPFTCIGGLQFLLIMVACIGLSLSAGLYLNGFLGVDVFGLNRLLRIPRGRPFTGLEPGEHEVLHLRRTQGGLGLGAGFGFKLLLTNRRLLAGSCLTSWYLVEVRLEDVARVERPAGFLSRTAIRLHMRSGGERSHWDIRLVRPAERERLIEELSELVA